MLAEYGRCLGLVDFCDMAGIKPLALFVSGPEMDDFEHVLTIWNAGYFGTPYSLLVVNEHLVSGGRTPMSAFDIIMARPKMRQVMKEGLIPLYMPCFPCMKEMRAAGLSLLDAVANNELLSVWWTRGFRPAP